MKILFALYLLLPGLMLGPVNLLDSYLLTSSSSLKIEGTSSLHDWEMEASSFDGKATFQVDEAGELSIQSLRISLKAENLKSGHGSMDNNAYEALKTDKYPEIIFLMKNVVSSTKEGNNYNVKVNGNLTIAGKIRSVYLTAVCKPQTNGSFEFEGETTLKMTDYGIEPPTAIFGTIKTGDEITIKYVAKFSKNNL